MNKVGIGVFCRIFTHDEIVQKVVAGLQKWHVHYPKQLTTSYPFSHILVLEVTEGLYSSRGDMGQRKIYRFHISY